MTTLEEVDRHIARLQGFEDDDLPMVAVRIDERIAALEALNVQLAAALEEFIWAATNDIRLALFKRNAARTLIEQVKK